MESREHTYRGRSRGNLPRGVRKCRAGYRAEVSVRGVLHNLGVYSTQGEAAAVYWREKGRIQQRGGRKHMTRVHQHDELPLQASDSDSIEQLPLFMDPLFMDPANPQRGNAKWSAPEHRQLVELVSQGTSIADIAVVLQRTEAGVLQRYVKLVQEAKESHELPTLIPPAKKVSPPPQKRAAHSVSAVMTAPLPRISKSKQGWWNRLWHGAVKTPKVPAVGTELAAIHVELVALRAAHNNLLVQLGEEPTDVH